MPLTLVGVLVLTFAALAASQTSNVLGPQTASRLVFFGSDSILVAPWSGGVVIPQPLRLEGGPTNIIAASASAESLYLVGDAAPEDGFAVFEARSSDPRWHRLFRARIQSLATSPRGDRIGFTTPSGTNGDTDAYDLAVYNISTGQTSQVAKHVAGYRTSLSWQSDPEGLTFDAPDGWIKSISLNGERMTRLVEGEAPAWSPDGKRLAFRRGKTVLIQPAGSTEPVSVYRRWFWQSGFAGPTYWSPDGRYLSMNANAGLSGKQLKCLVIDIESRNVITAHEGSYWCGPWLSKPWGQ